MGCNSTYAKSWKQGRPEEKPTTVKHCEALYSGGQNLSSGTSLLASKLKKTRWSHTPHYIAPVQAKPTVITHVRHLCVCHEGIKLASPAELVDLSMGEHQKRRESLEPPKTETRTLVKRSRRLLRSVITGWLPSAAQASITGGTRDRETDGRRPNWNQQFSHEIRCIALYGMRRA